MDVHIVVGRDDDGGFEFARQIGFAQNRFDVVGDFFVARFGRFGGEHFFAVQPDIGVSHGARQKVHTDAFCPFVGFLVQRALNGIAGAKYVAVDVAGGGDGIEAEFVQGLVRQFQIGF